MDNWCIGLRMNALTTFKLALSLRTYAIAFKVNIPKEVTYVDIFSWKSIFLWSFFRKVRTIYVNVIVIFTMQFVKRLYNRNLKCLNYRMVSA